MNSITVFENTLRSLIIKIIGDSDDSPYKVPDARSEKWKEKREIEKKKYKDLLTENRLIFYSDFYDLQTIIDKNWNLFLPVFHDKKRFEVFFAEVEKFRNTLSHGRSLTSSQEKLLEGITGDLKNTITVFHNKNDMQDDYFIRIIRITDSLGNVWENSVQSPSSGKKPVLRVGDDYELIVEANDPKDRGIKYKITTIMGHLKIGPQDSNRFNFQIEKNLIGTTSMVTVGAFTPSADYDNEDHFVIILTVLPKLE